MMTQKLTQKSETSSNYFFSVHCHTIRYVSKNNCTMISSLVCVGRTADDISIDGKRG